MKLVHMPNFTIELDLYNVTVNCLNTEDAADVYRLMIIPVE